MSLHIGVVINSPVQVKPAKIQQSISSVEVDLQRTKGPGDNGIIFFTTSQLKFFRKTGRRENIVNWVSGSEGRPLSHLNRLTTHLE